MAGSRPTAGFSGGRAARCASSGSRPTATSLWHALAEPVLIETSVLGVVDAAFRRQMCQLHTDLHIVNALAFQAFDGALVTGAQIGDDGTARIDLDLPGADSDRVRALEPAINDAIRQGPCRQPALRAGRHRGCRARAPPQPVRLAPRPSLMGRSG